MAKCWQWWKDVPIKSFALELAAVDFLEAWEYAGKSYTYCDWMIRDFLSYLVGKAGSFELVPGTHEILWLGDAWKSKAETALSVAQKACQLEADKEYADASVEWQKLFGTLFPSS